MKESLEQASSNPGSQESLEQPPSDHSSTGAEPEQLSDILADFERDVIASLNGDTAAYLRLQLVAGSWLDDLTTFREKLKNPEPISDFLQGLGVTEKGWGLPSALSARVWKIRGEQLIGSSLIFCWAAADLAAFGRTHFPNLLKSNQPLDNIALLGEAFPPEYREAREAEYEPWFSKWVDRLTGPHVDLIKLRILNVYFANLLNHRKVAKHEFDYLLSEFGIRIKVVLREHPLTRYPQADRINEMLEFRAYDSDHSWKTIFRDLKEIGVNHLQIVPWTPDVSPIIEVPAPSLRKEGYTERIRDVVQGNPGLTLEEVQRIVSQTHPEGSQLTLSTTVASMKATIRQLLRSGWTPPPEVDQARYKEFLKSTGGRGRRR